MGLYKQALYKMAEETSANVGGVYDGPNGVDRLESDYFTSYPGTTAPVPRTLIGEGFRRLGFGNKFMEPITKGSLERARRAQAEVAAGKFAPQHTPFYNRLRDSFIRSGKMNWYDYQNGFFAPGMSKEYWPLNNTDLKKMEQYKVLSEEQKKAIEDQHKEMVYNNNANTGYRYA